MFFAGNHTSKQFGHISCRVVMSWMHTERLTGKIITKAAVTGRPFHPATTHIDRLLVCCRDGQLPEFHVARQALLEATRSLHQNKDLYSLSRNGQSDLLLDAPQDHQTHRVVCSFLTEIDSLCKARR